MAPMRRNCYLPDEKVLSFFPSYSESNCLLECAWSLARETCSCVPWHLANYYPDADLCEFHGKRCFDSIVDKRFDKVENGDGEESGTDCQMECLRDCQNVYYSVKTSMTPSQESRYVHVQYHMSMSLVNFS